MFFVSRQMELETEIPIWFNGKVKWISNLSCRSKCCDIIEAILSSNKRLCEINDEYILYECWRGVERALKPRCRLLKLWKSWEKESENVILTLRSSKEEKIPKYFKIREQNKKLNKLKNEIKKKDEQINKLNISFKTNHFLNLSNSIYYFNQQIQNQENIIFYLKNQIQNQIQNDFKQILFDVNQTLSYSRKLTNLSDQLDQQIYLINQNIEKKQIILDELELDWALQENIYIHSLDDDQYQHSFKQNSPSPPNLSPILPIKTLTGFIFFSFHFYLFIKIVLNRPTAIVEPNLSKLKSKESLSINKTSSLKLNKLKKQEKIFTKTKIEFIPFSIPKKSFFQLDNNNNDESDTGISSIYSNDEQLITLV